MRRAKEIEFIQLKQGSMCMPVGEYASKFAELGKYFTFFYHPKESMKCIKFENGLREELRKAIGILEIDDFHTLIHKCKFLEDFENNQSILDPKQIKINALRENLTIARNGGPNPTNLHQEILVDLYMIILDALNADKVILLKIVILRDQSVSSVGNLVNYSLNVDNRSHISIQLQPRQDLPQQEECTP